MNKGCPNNTMAMMRITIISGPDGNAPSRKVVAIIKTARPAITDDSDLITPAMVSSTVRGCLTVPAPTV